MPMTLDKAKRILPSFVAHCGQGVTDLAILRQRVEHETAMVTIDLMRSLSFTHTGSFQTDEAKAIDRKLDQLNRFLEATTK